MRALIINAVCGILSTGRICTDIAEELEKNGYEVKIAYGRKKCPDIYRKYAVKIGCGISVCWDALMSKLFDSCGLWNRRATKKFLKWAEEFNPDVLWLHNIHDHYINYKMLFDWIKQRPQMTVKWTQHDCWAFTGGCMHFLISGCNGWQNGCECCLPDSKKNIFPLKLRKKKQFALKKECFSSINNMLLISPSQWLADLIKKSFLNEYPIEVVHNAIDTSIFKPTFGDFRERFKLQDKKVILGVASVWSDLKGLSDFFKLAKNVGDEYAIVLVGLNNKQIKHLPKNIIGIKRTDSKVELAKIYSAADLFFNPTYEDNYPTVNLEAEACGVPVVTYDTGGCRETIKRSDSKVIPVGKWEWLLNGNFSGQ